MLWGTFAATVKGQSITGDYRRAGPARLELTFANGVVTIWSASLKFIEEANARATYDFTADVLSEAWSPRAALRKMRRHPRAEIADVLLDQEIFAGVGNIIKNEVLFRARTSPFARVGRLSARTLNAIVADARTFSFRFLELRRRSLSCARILKSMVGASVRPAAGRVSRAVHGTRRRRSFFCVGCQKASSDRTRDRPRPS